MKSLREDNNWLDRLIELICYKGFPALLVCILVNDLWGFFFAEGRTDQIISALIAAGMVGLHQHTKSSSDFDKLVEAFVAAAGLAVLVAIGVMTRPWWDFVNLFFLCVAFVFFLIQIND